MTINVEKDFQMIEKEIKLSKLPTEPEEEILATFKKEKGECQIRFLIPPVRIPLAYYEQCLEKFKSNGLKNADLNLRSQFVYRAAVRVSKELLQYAEDLEGEGEDDGEVEIPSAK